MPRPRSVSIVAGFFGCWLASASPALAQVDLEVLAWGMRCEVLRSELGTDPNAAVTYSERPAALPMVDVWPLNAHGFNLPVPAMTYTDVIVSREGNEPVTVVLVGLRQNAVIAASVAVEPLDDAFAGTNWLGAPGSTEMGRQWTYELFDGPVDLSQLTDLGYRSSPADLTCDPANWRAEIPMAIALTLKGGGPGALLHVYPTAGTGLGWLTEREVDGQMIWEATRATTGRVWFANLSGPEGGPMRDLGFGIDHPDLAATSDAPLWLGALQDALSAPDQPGHWSALADALAADGLSGRSVEAARALAASLTN